jgi:hypothetical protein
MTNPGVINIKAGDTGYDLPTPEYGYETTISTALIHTERLPRGYGIWDNGTANIRRVFKGTWLLDATDTGTLLAIFNDITKGRGISVTLKLGTEPTGFYPFGPDHGDEGDFDCRMISIDPKPLMEEPRQYFRTEISFVEESNPAYSLPVEISEGDLQIGTITNLRDPPDMPESRTRYGFSTQLTRDGTAYTIDKRSTVDYNATKLGMVCNQSKAAALINHLLATVRNNNVAISSQANNYIFGQPGGSSGYYSCQWLDEVLKIKHVSYDRFNFDLNFWGYVAI